MSLYDPALAAMLDWLTTFGFIGLTAFVIWQILIRSQKS
jgi:TRAP-type C4-dicarboxylate transport system permease small subunit